jgi:thioredoxin reductase (NADPH)
MARPVLLAVDDDRAVLNAVERDLRQKYGREYRVLKAGSGAAALDVLQQLRRRNETVALFLVDQRMPQLSGVEFLEQARQIFPESKKVLLTAYADTEAAIAAINRVGVDYYLLKPWDPPAEHLYPVLDDLLEEWRAQARLPFDGLRLAGTLWSPQAHALKDFLVRHRIPYQWLDVEADPAAAALAAEANQGTLTIPTVFFADGSALVDPPLRTLAERLGMQTRPERPFYDLVIVGSGPAGLAAAVYGATEGLRVVVIEKQAPGGQAGSSPKIENYLGFPGGLSGGELARRAVAQARRFGAEILSAQEAACVRVEEPYRIVQLADGAELVCHAVLLATGASFHTLTMPGAAELTGRGVYYGAAYTEALFYRDQDVVVVGGANSAAQGALFLARFARSVTMLVRGPEPTASAYLVDALQRSEGLTLRCNAELVAVHGEDRLSGVTIRAAVSGATETIPGAALFVFIGVRPQSGLVADLVLRDPRGHVLTGGDLRQPDGRWPKSWPLARDPLLLETSVPGIFAAGDVRFGTSHRVASAAGEGGVAIAMIREYLRSR